MDMQWLEDVLVLLEEGNMTRAASRRNITQPAFSRRIRGFEEWLGAPVLKRGTNRIDISPALTENEVEIRALIARVRDLRGKIANFDPANSTMSIAAQHAPIFSVFPDMAVLAKRHFPSLKFRLRAGNLHDCVTMFLRGDTSMLLCYESQKARALSFGETVRREYWGNDHLVPVVGGALRYLAAKDGGVADNTPAAVYPETSYFGEVLSEAEKPFGTSRFSKNPVYETAFSSGIKELVRTGMGVGWLPYSTCHNEIESGDFFSLANQFGRESLKVALYADIQDETAGALLSIWSGNQG